MIEYENLKKVNEELFNAYQQVFHEFLNSGKYILGANVEAFESEFARFCGVEFCVGVASGLDALTIAIDACDFPDGAEIIVPSNSYIATILAVVRNRCCPVLVEPDIRTYNIDPGKIEEKITCRTKAILPVHLYGKPCDMDKIAAIATKYNLEIIEDCAQAHGAMYNGKRVGSFGVGCFSFYPTKNMGGLGDAGAIVSSDPKFMERVKALRCYGKTRQHYFDYVGYNSRMDELQAAFLRIKLRVLEKINAHKRKLAQLYIDNLNKSYITPTIESRTFDIYHIFAIMHNRRDALKEYLFAHGVTTAIHYLVPPVKQKALVGIISGEYPISEKIHNEILSLPISYCHSAEDIFGVIDVMNNWGGR